MRTAYVDSSALTKLVLDEPDSAAMRRWYVEAEQVACSVIGMIETRRAVAGRAGDHEHLEIVLRSVVKLEIDAFVVQAAGVMSPPALRTLDAIHIASAQAVGGELDAFVTYDDRLADAARAVGLPVVRPA